MDHAICEVDQESMSNDGVSTNLCGDIQEEVMVLSPKYNSKRLNKGLNKDLTSRSTNLRSCSKFNSLKLTKAKSKDAIEKSKPAPKLIGPFFPNYSFTQQAYNQAEYLGRSYIALRR